MYHIFFNHLFVNEHLGCFHVLTMNIGVHVFSLISFLQI